MTAMQGVSGWVETRPDVIKRLWSVGAGEQISRMVVGALRDCGQLSGASDVKADVYVCRVLGRAVCGEQTTPEIALQLARRLYPSDPWQLDGPVWNVGKNHCHANNPDCSPCYLAPHCAYALKAHVQSASTSNNERAKKMEDDELIRLVSESEEISNRLIQLRERKAEHDSVLAKLDERHGEIVDHIHDLTKRLNRVSKELRSVASERIERTGEHRHLAAEIKETAKQSRAVRRRIQDCVGRDVCPKCGSTEIATVSYGYPVQEPDDDLFEPDYVMGGCHINLDETVCCLDCGKHFLGNFDKWQRAQVGSKQTGNGVGGWSRGRFPICCQAAESRRELGVLDPL